MQDKKQSLVPELRFPGFEGEWEEKSLGEVGYFVRGLSYNKAEVTQTPSATLVIRSNNIIQDGEVDCKNGLQFVTKQPSNEQILQKGDVVICLANGSSNLVGKTAGFEGNYSGIATVGAFCGIYRSSFPITKYLVQTPAYKKSIDLIKQGGNGALANLYGKDILALKFLFPSLPEQQKIAECLSSVDDLIQAEADQLQALKDHKKGLMQQLFPIGNEQLAMSNGNPRIPRLRFPGFEGEWEEKKFNDIFSLLSNNTCSRAEMDNNIGVALNVHYGDILTKYNEILDVQKTNIPYVTDNDLLVKYKDSFLQDGDIIISDTAEDSTVGKCTEIQNHQEQEIIILSGLHTIPVRPQRKFAKGYLGYFLNSESYHNQLLPLMQGAKVSSISRTAIKKTEIFFPSLPEQQKIADCLSSLDEGIAAQQEKVEALKEHKKGLMQKLFPNLQ